MKRLLFVFALIAAIAGCSGDKTSKKTGGIEYQKASESYVAPSSTSRGSKPVNVQGYHKKNGTYVAPHTRSAPKK